MGCEACGAELQRGVAELDAGDGQGRTVVAQAGWYCPECGAARFSAGDLYEAERQLPSRTAAEAPRFVAVAPGARAA